MVPFQDYSCSLLANLFVAVQFGYEISDLTRLHIFAKIIFHVEKIQPLKRGKNSMYSVLNRFRPIWTSIDQFAQVHTNLDTFGPICTSSYHYGQMVSPKETEWGWVFRIL